MACPAVVSASSLELFTAFRARPDQASIPCSGPQTGRDLPRVAQRQMSDTPLTVRDRAISPGYLVSKSRG
jgi:hypothetical protein